MRARRHSIGISASMLWFGLPPHCRQREESKAKGEAALAAGEAGAAAHHFAKSVGVTYTMAQELIKVTCAKE